MVIYPYLVLILIYVIYLPITTMKGLDWVLVVLLMILLNILK
jgi:hypothetical protein